MSPDTPLPVILATPESRPCPATLSGFFLQYLQTTADLDRTQRQFWGYLAQQVMPAQVFDYGEFAESQFRTESQRGGELIGAGYLRPPYESGVYHYTLSGMPTSDGGEGGRHVLDDGRARYCTVICGPHLPPNSAENSTGHYLVVDFLRMGREEGALIARGMGRRAEPGSRFWLCAGAGVIETLRDGLWTGYLMDHAMVGTDDKLRQQSLLGSLADGIGALSMIICTKGIRLHREPAPEKLNAKRAKAGKPPLTLVTHVDARGYFEAAARTDRGGTHASPVPHLRRGHIRTYKSDGHKTWVRPMLVNCRSMEELPTPRDHYEVKA